VTDTEVFITGRIGVNGYSNHWRNLFSSLLSMY